MAYVALYRKYRSQSFDELMGQDHVTRTLQNAIKSGHIAQAYLFHGARGCGKTSTARLLARALNCVAQDGPTPEPCGVCRLCVSIREGSCLDVVEIDAASETGVDNVREKVIENVQYAPAEARYKVYIIDEVHDLSAKAFDALLKTIEEPPAHVVFVLATTEYHKVPITIRSRCQNYQFKRGSLHDLAASIASVIAKEGYTAEPEAVQSIARSAEGSWRDALSLLEQVLAYSEGHVTAETVNKAIGTVGAATLARVTETLAEGRWDATLAIASELVDSGIDVRQLLTALQAHLRDLLLVCAAPQHAMQELGPDRVALLAPQADKFAPPTLLTMLGTLTAAEREFRFTNQHRILLETALLRLMPGVLPQMQAQNPAADTRQTSPQTAPLAATPSVVPKPSIPHPPTFAPLDVEPAEPVEPDFSTPEPQTSPSASAVSASTPPSAVPEVESDAVPEEDNAGRFASDVTMDVLQRAWPRLLKDFGKTSPAGLSYLANAHPIALDGKTITLGFQQSFARDRIQNKGRDAVEKSINKSLQTEGYKIQCMLVENGNEPGMGAKPTNDPAPPPVPMALMEAPEATPPPPASRSIMDFASPAAPPPANSNNGTNGAHREAANVVNSVSEPVASLPPSNDLLKEVLSLFEGEVVRTERI